MCLFRIAELSSGSIYIDGNDISSLSLASLRSMIQIVPQTPVLFEGTVRSYMDPFGQFEDSEIWEVIVKAQLGDVVQSLPAKLKANSEHEILANSNLQFIPVFNPTRIDSNGKFEADNSRDHRLSGLIEENGNNLSVGERQLLVLARALLNKSKILVMDEATASIDYKTDSIIQSLVKNEFKDSTIFTIAHRINTIINYDKIIVLEAGSVLEMGSPQTLLSRDDGAFSKLHRSQSTL